MIQVPWVGTGIRYGLYMLQQYTKRVRIKRQKALRVSSYILRRYRGKTWNHQLPKTTNQPTNFQRNNYHPVAPNFNKPSTKLKTEKGCSINGKLKKWQKILNKAKTICLRSCHGRNIKEVINFSKKSYRSYIWIKKETNLYQF